MNRAIILRTFTRRYARATLSNDSKANALRVRSYRTCDDRYASYAFKILFGCIADSSFMYVVKKKKFPTTALPLLQTV